MNVSVDNDLLGIESPPPFKEWSLEEEALTAAGFWGAIAQELDHALIRDVGVEPWTRYVREILRAHQAAYFIQGCEKLGLADVEPDTLKCALYHCHSNSLGGNRVRYARGSESKGWIFYLPATMGAGTALYPDEYMLAIFGGWHVNNGPSLGNDRMAFVVTHLMSRGDPYDAGYFVDTGEVVHPENRLRVALGEEPPPLSELEPASLDEEVWPAARRWKALRNFAVEWAWERATSAIEMFGTQGAASVGHAVGVVANGYLPYFEAALDAEGAELVGRYFAAVHSVAGWHVSVEEASGSVVVELDRDPLAGPSKEIPDDVARAALARLERAWSTIAAVRGVTIERRGFTYWTFTDG
jgi:hypothetical protein